MGQVVTDFPCPFGREYDQSMADYSAEFQKTAEEMRQTEQELLATGFSTEQWKLLKKYIELALNLSNFASAQPKGKSI